MTEFEEYKQHLETFHNNACKVMHNKAQDYTGGENPMLNFINASEMAGITVEQGLIYMMSIKLTRARILTEQGSLVGKVGEKLADTLGDLSNYAGILDYWTAINYNSEAVNQLTLDFLDDNPDKYKNKNPLQHQDGVYQTEVIGPTTPVAEDNKNWWDKLWSGIGN